MIDSTFNNVQVGILTSNREDQPPNIVVDGVEFSGGTFILAGSEEVLLQDAPSGVWAIGAQFTGANKVTQAGAISEIPPRPSTLQDNKSNKFFVRSRPQYESLNAEDFLSAAAVGIANDGTGDQTAQINKFLQDAVDTGKIAYFPAGIYLVQDTITVPLGSRIQGSSWSQVSKMFYFRRGGAYE